MARTEVFIIDDANPSGHWVWVGGYTGPGVGIAHPLTASGALTAAGSAGIEIPGVLSLAASGGPLTVDGSAAIDIPATAQYLNLPGGGSTSYAEIADAAEFDFPGSHKIRVRMKVADWTLTTDQPIITKWSNTAGQQSWFWRINRTTLAADTTYFQWTTNGTSGGGTVQSSTNDPVMPDNTLIWVQYELNSSNRQITISTHADQTAEPTTGWTQVAQSSAGSATGTIYSGTAAVRIGAWVSGSAWLTNAQIYQLTLRNASDTLVFSLDPDNWTTGSTWVTNSGHTVTMGAAASVGP